jgi:UDP-2,4-diacetamido-2,4,6-trideoxy-beta-L-altropyranose hydrolase
MPEQLIVRADANALVGTGHLMRCLALAQSWKTRGGKVTFITCCESRDLRESLSDAGMQVVMLDRTHPNPLDWELTSQVLQEHSKAWVVLDGYHFDPEYQRRVKNTGQQLLVIDDTAHLDHYYADTILNQNISADKLSYSCEPNTRLLLGTKYVLLRSEFHAWRDWQREVPEIARRALVTLGGGDPYNVTLQVINSLKILGISDLEVRVVVGASNPHIQILREALFSVPCTIRLLHNVENMPDLMAWADLAVSAGGSTAWELAFMGVPALILTIADNQEGTGKDLQHRGAALNLGWYHMLDVQDLKIAVCNILSDREKRAEMSENGTKLVDGNGVNRLCSFLKRDS